MTICHCPPGKHTKECPVAPAEGLTALERNEIAGMIRRRERGILLAIDTIVSKLRQRLREVEAERGNHCYKHRTTALLVRIVDNPPEDGSGLVFCPECESQLADAQGKLAAAQVIAVRLQKFAGGDAIAITMRSLGDELAAALGLAERGGGK